MSAFDREVRRLPSGREVTLLVPGRRGGGSPLRRWGRADADRWGRSSTRAAVDGTADVNPTAEVPMHED